MGWGNNQFGKNKEAKPSRVIIRTKDPGSPELVKYLKENNLSTDADKTRFSRYRQVVEIVVNISWISGAVMLLFALLIFTLFIQLTIASCKDEITLLITLGASPGQLRSFLIKQFFPVNIVIISISILLISITQIILHEKLRSQNIVLDKFPSISTMITGILVLLVIWLVNYLSIQKFIKQTSGND
jgi:cell division protein FtsX